MHQPKKVSVRNNRDSRLGRLAFFALTVVYLAFFQCVYIEDLSPVYAYMGLTYSEPSLTALMIAWTLALAPSALLDLGLKKPSDFILIVLYIFVYTPSMFVPLYVRWRQGLDLVSLEIALLLGFSVMILILRGEPMPYRIRALGRKRFWQVIWGLYAVCVVWIIAVFRGSLQLVSLGDVYGLRFESRAIFDQSNVGFAVMMMMGSLNPMLIALGLQNQDRVVLFAGIAGQVLCYSTGGFKSIAFSMVVLLILHFFLRKHMSKATHWLMVLSITLLLSCHVLSKADDDRGLVTVVSNVSKAVISRAIVIPGLLTAEYHDFFETHPHLHMAETKPFSWVLSSPLKGDVIFLVSEYYTGNSETTSNAHFWAQDGIANFGLLGIFAISIVTGSILRMVDRLSAGHVPCFAAMVFSFSAFNLANAPLTTTLLSGGLILSMLLMALAGPHVGRVAKIEESRLDTRSRD